MLLHAMSLHATNKCTSGKRETATCLPAVQYNSGSCRHAPAGGSTQAVQFSNDFCQLQRLEQLERAFDLKAALHLTEQSVCATSRLICNVTLRNTASWAFTSCSLWKCLAALCWFFDLYISLSSMFNSNHKSERVNDSCSHQLWTL